MIELLVTCLAPIIINETPNWNDFDDRALFRAKFGCKRYYTENHCLSKFIKKEEKRYHAICKKVLK